MRARVMANAILIGGPNKLGRCGLLRCDDPGGSAKMKCTVLGGGSWGTALAVQLARVGHETILWDRNPDRCASINQNHRNPRYLKDVPLPAELRAEADLNAAVTGARLLVPRCPLARAPVRVDPRCSERPVRSSCVLRHQGYRGHHAIYDVSGLC